MEKQPGDGSLPIAAPLEIASPEDGDWDSECGLLVAGFGAAGAAASISAKQAGVDVHIVDRFNGGGATAKSGGVVYAGGGTPQQIKAGYNDTPEAMFQYLRLETGDAIKEQTLRRFCEDSRGLIEWLESLGASFESNTPPPKTSYPKNGTYLYFSGNEAVAPYSDAAVPAPRGHRTVDKGLSGKKLFSFLNARVEQLNIPVTRQAALRRLIVQANTGAVLGAEVWRIPPASAAAKKHQRLIGWAELLHNVAPAAADRLRIKAQKIEFVAAQPQRIRAQVGVLLTTGGFIFNRAMLAQHAPKYLPNMRIGTTGCDGSGIRMGQSAGGQTARLHKVSAWRFINPPQAWAKGFVVNSAGQRFCNEASYGARLGVAMCESDDGRAWLILDSKLRKAAFRECLRDGLWGFQKYPAMLMMLFAPRARSLAALAGKMGVPAEPLHATTHRYNSASESLPDALGKSAQMCTAVDKAPYYALDISATNPIFPCPAITLGGLCVDEESGAVLDNLGQAIPGLFAAGRAAVGIASNGYVSGLSLADCLWSGRRVGAALHHQVQEHSSAA